MSSRDGSGSRSGCGGFMAELERMAANSSFIIVLKDGSDSALQVAICSNF